MFYFFLATPKIGSYNVHGQHSSDSCSFPWGDCPPPCCLSHSSGVQKGVFPCELMNTTLNNHMICLIFLISSSSTYYYCGWWTSDSSKSLHPPTPMLPPPAQIVGYWSHGSFSTTPLIVSKCTWGAKVQTLLMVTGTLKGCLSEGAPLSLLPSGTMVHSIGFRGWVTRFKFQFSYLLAM